MHYFLILLLLVGCSSSKEKLSKKQNLYGEVVYRLSKEKTEIPPQIILPKPSYDWSRQYAGLYPKITKDFFRCKGSSTSPLREVGEKKIRDCTGAHGLPMKDGKEFIYPKLLEILNYLQEKTGRKVVVTCGHACPEHNRYLDDSTYNVASKHMIGAEVDFYVEGMESTPLKVVDLIQELYATPLKRYEKSNINVATPPWLNKEIFIKLYLSHEGRDCDNAHPYPYISIQMRADPETSKSIAYDHKQAQNYLRY